MTAKTYEQIWSQGAELLKKHKQPRTVSPLWTALVKHQGEKMNEEDEAFEQLSLKQGSWEHTSGWRKKQIKEYEEMAIDNSTGKDKEFYDLGKKMFDRIQPITRGVPQIPQERYSKRPWVGLTDKEILADDVLRYHFGLNGGGGPVSKSGRKIVDAIEKKIKGIESMKAPPPSKELCLLMAKINYTRDEKLSWTWLFAWGFHEAYVDGWYEGVKL